MDGFDFSPLFRSTIGFDRLMRLVDSATRVDRGASYPPYNIESHRRERLSPDHGGGGLRGRRARHHRQGERASRQRPLAQGGRAAEYLHRGIARRAFERRFQLADHIKVMGASLDNGLLHVDLVREIPEAMKPRKIEIAVGATPREVIDQRAA